MLNMNDKLPINTLSKVIKLRNTLDKISQVSWSFSILNKSHPIGTLDTEEDAALLTQAYNELIEDAKDIISRHSDI